MRGSGWRKVHHPDHLARVEARFRRAFERAASRGRTRSRCGRGTARTSGSCLAPSRGATPPAPSCAGTAPTPTSAAGGPPRSVCATRRSGSGPSSTAPRQSSGRPTPRARSPRASGAGPPIPARATRRPRAGAGSRRSIRRPGARRRGVVAGGRDAHDLRGRVPDAPPRRRVAPHGRPRRPGEGRGRRDPRMGRHACRHHRAQGGRGGGSSRPGRRRRPPTGPRAVHRQHEPRAAHAALGRHRLFRDAGRGAGGSRPGRPAARPAQDRSLGPPPARAHQRRARHLEDRGRADG